MESRALSGACAPLQSLRRASKLPSGIRLSSLVNYHSTARRPEQVNPLGDYYNSILSQPLPPTLSATRQTTTQTALPKTDKEETLAKARVVFGSRLAGPEERKSEINKKSTLVAGVWVPPRPQEPDNCCMSGCVNCVWDQYGEEMEDWARARKAADTNLHKESSFEKGRSRRTKPGTGFMLGKGEKDTQHTLSSLDDDGGGSDTKSTSSLDTDLFSGIPVGILEFMKQEKRLKEKHAREGTIG